MLRAWLGSVLQGQVRSAWRSRQRRAERERRFARAEGDGDAAADLIVGRAESAQLLVEEVHGLPEPHRSTLLLFYVEGLSAGPLLPPDTWDVRVECEGFPATERTAVLEAGAALRIKVRLE